MAALYASSSQPAARRAAQTQPSADAAGLLLVCIVCSLAASVATCAGMIHFFWVPPAVVAPAAGKPGTGAAAKSGSLAPLAQAGGNSPAPTSNPDDPVQNPAAASANALAVINALKTDSAFAAVRGQAKLVVALDVLRVTAAAMGKNDSVNPQLAANHDRSFVKMLNSALSISNDLANRPNLPDDVRNEAAQINNQLQQLKNQ